MIGCLYFKSYPGRDALLDMFLPLLVRVKGLDAAAPADTKPSPSKSLPPPATEEEEAMLEELSASPPCPYCSR